MSIMRAVLLYHAAGLIAYHAARVLIIMQRGSISSYSGVIVNHSAGFCFIIPRCYSAGGSALSCRGVIVYHAGGSALSCRGVLLFSIMPAVYIIMQRVHGSGSRSYCLSCRRSTSSCRGAYCLSGSGYMVQVAGLIAYHSARFLIIMQRGSTSSCRRFSVPGIIFFCHKLNN